MSTSASGGEIFSAPYVVEHTFRRSLGPVMSRFLTGLRDRRIEGIRTRDGRVMDPPREYDPESGEEITTGAAGSPGICVQYPTRWKLRRYQGSGQ